jgi:hypothetical protein
MALIDIQRNGTGFEQPGEALAQAQEVLLRVAQYSQPIREVQMVCNDPQQIIYLDRQITDLQTKKILPPQCDHTWFEQQIQTLKNEQNEARRRPAAPGMDKDLREELAQET